MSLRLPTQEAHVCAPLRHRLLVANRAGLDGKRLTEDVRLPVTRTAGGEERRLLVDWQLYHPHDIL